MITKTPILILSAPRTGSTVLGKHIQSLCKQELPYFIEPDYYGAKKMEEFHNYFSTSKDFILKCHLMHLHKYGEDVSNYLLDNAYKVRVRRRDFTKQIASLYIALARNNKWHFKEKEQLNFADQIPINPSIIKDHIFFLKEANNALDNTSIKFDLEFFYEDLPSMDALGYYQSPKPTNYIDLISAIEDSMSGRP